MSEHGRIRAETLLAAKAAVCQDRAAQYGSLEDNFETIAKLWSVYLGQEVAAHDVAALMILFKTARVRANPGHPDSWVDVAGYAACGNEVAQV